MTLQAETQLPIARLVFGHPMILKQDTDFYTKQPKNDKNGEPLMGCYFQVAVKKDDPGLPDVWQAFMQGSGRQLPAQPDLDGFSWKIEDGDSMRLNSKTNQQEPRGEHSRGCWLFNIKSYKWVSDAVKHDGNRYVAITNPQEIKTGDYIRVAVKIEHNGAQGNQEGVYLNPSLVFLAGIGDPISSGGYGVNDAANVFGDGQATQGMQQQPQGGMPQQIGGQPQGGMPQQMGGQPQGGMPQQMGGQPQGGMPAQQPQGGMPAQQPQGGMPAQQMGGQPQGGMPAQQPQGGMPQGGMPAQQMGNDAMSATNPAQNGANGVQPHTGILNPNDPNGGVAF